MVDDNTKTLGMVAIAGFIGYKVMSGVGSTVTAPFDFAADTAGGAFDFAGDIGGGALNFADTSGDFVGGLTGGAGDIVNGTFGAINDGFDFAAGGAADVISAPGNIAEDAYGGVTSTVDNVGDSIANALPF